MTASIERTLEFQSSIERVWKALTDAKELNAWFPNDGAEFEPTPGFIGWFAWNIEECTGRYAVEVMEVEPMQRISWRWAREADVSITEAYTTLVEWQLESLPNGGTRVHMVESGFDQDKDRADNVQGWKQELGELVDYLNA